MKHLGRIVALGDSILKGIQMDPETKRYVTRNEIGIPALDTVTDFASFLDAISSALAQGVPDEEGVLPSDIPAGIYQMEDKAFAFGALITALKDDGTESAMMSLMFVFRE